MKRLATWSKGFTGRNNHNFCYFLNTYMCFAFLLILLIFQCLKIFINFYRILLTLTTWEKCHFNVLISKKMFSYICHSFKTWKFLELCSYFAYFLKHLRRHHINCARIQVFFDSHKYGIYDFIIIREKVDQWKPVFWHISRTENWWEVRFLE